MTTTKQKITQSFRDLRKAGYFARQNFWCCQGCGWSAIPEESKHKAVFYHRQDTESFDGKELKRPLHLAWDGDGHEIAGILRNNGLSVEWNGSPDTRIKVLPKGADNDE